MRNKKSLIYRIGHPINYKLHSFKEWLEAKKFEQSVYGYRLREYKNIAIKDRCFILGNGPSLSIQDLDTLHANEEVCFASNRVYGIYNQTKWRPTYYGCQDDRVMRQIYADIPMVANESRISFISINNYEHHDFIYETPVIAPFFIKMFPTREHSVCFSEDISSGICEGMTITYTLAQIAMYMGYKEIYFLGVDHNQSVPKENESNDEINYFKGIKKVDASDFYPPHFDIMNEAYTLLKKVADVKGIKICNATRGGKLEIFERVDFDRLF